MALRPGYTALLTVPHDLPIFLDIALQNIAAQNLEHMLEILVIPDRPSKAFRARYETSIARFALPPIRLVEMGTRDKLIGRVVNTPAMYHFLQLLNGTEAATTTHLLFHDADLFLRPGDFLKSRFIECADKRLSALGVDLPPHQAGNNFIADHMVATWEMLASREWLMRFSPIEHKSHFRHINGKAVRFDTTLWPQYQSNPVEFAKHEMDNLSYVHFGNIVTTYRKFRRARKPFEDTRFRILLIRLLIDAMSNGSTEYESIPSLEDCIRGIDGRGPLVSYTAPKTPAHYMAFRDHLVQLSGLNVLSEGSVRRLNDSLAPFDSRFSYSASA
jgi:hypothetical protein